MAAARGIAHRRSGATATFSRLASSAALGAALCVAGSPHAHAQTSIAAHLRSDTITCESLQADTARACAAALLAELRRRAEQDFVAAANLQASAEEIDAVRAYEQAFAAHDREQRARKLAELELRLQRMPSDASAERARLLEFRAVLERLEAYEADIDRGLEPRPEAPVASVVHWIEQAKLDAALYERYGGTVGLKPAGAYAHAARAALVAEYMLREQVTLPDRALAREFFAALWAPPAIAYTGTAPDFTPFWQRPLKPSYVDR